MPEKKKKDSRLERAGVSGYNKPKRTPNHPTKSHIVVAKQGDKVKTIRFGQQGVKTNQTVEDVCSLLGRQS
jgi:anthranilate phosphoribosyltransferase